VAPGFVSRSPEASSQIANHSEYAQGWYQEYMTISKPTDEGENKTGE